MSASNFFKGNKNDNEHQETQEEKVINAEKERKGIRQKIRSDLRHKLKFTNAEIQEIIDIIDRSEREITYLKNSMAQVNTNNDNTEADIAEATRLIRKEGEKMAFGIKQKTAEILLRKKKK